jgi:NADH-quinone oxidoreductase subunit F
VISYFFRDESCGQCTQCREGTGWMYKLCRRIEEGRADAGDLKLLGEIGSMMEGQTICAFADAAAWPVGGLLRHFRGEFEAHVERGGCPFGESFAL